MNHRDTTIAIKRPSLLILGLLLIATTLRAPVTGVAPILDSLQSMFGLSPAEAGLLTTLPLLAFGVISPFAALFAREYGLERALFVALLLTVVGVAVRSLGLAWCLYAGTCCIGAGIAVGNVLLPSLAKRDFPARVPVIMGACALAMGGAAALASASAVPLSHAFGWQSALGGAAVFPCVAALVWTAQLRARTAPTRDTATPPHGGRVWHSALAWQVTLFMGINSLLYYVLVGWLPSILVDAGFSPAAAGSLHGVMQLASAMPGIVLGPVVNRMRDQRLLAALMGVLLAMALAGFRFAPALAVVWAFLFGFGAGGGVLLALIFMGLRTGNARQAAALSGMAQCIGYSLAACGPALAGKLHDVTGDWSIPLNLGIALSVGMSVFGVLAGRSRQIGMDHKAA
jgi:CP family cyanate transporter-like MFS transporter